MARVILAKPREVEEHAADFRPGALAHAVRQRDSTAWEASTMAAFNIVWASKEIAAGRARAAKPPVAGSTARLDGTLLGLVVEALAGELAAQAARGALRGRLDIYTGRDKQSFTCTEFMRALYHSGGVPVRRLWAGLELVVGAVSLYTRATEPADGATRRSYVTGAAFGAALAALLDEDRTPPDEKAAIGANAEAVWQRHQPQPVPAALASDTDPDTDDESTDVRVRLGEMLRVAVDTVPSDAAISSHEWEADDGPEECEDCGASVLEWCKHCEACKNCHDQGICHLCPIAGSYKHILRLAAADWQAKTWKERITVQYDRPGATGLQLYEAVLKTTGQNCLVIEVIDEGSASEYKGLECGMLLHSCQGRSAVGLQQDEMLYLPLDERPLRLTFVKCKASALIGDSRHNELEKAAKAKAAAVENARLKREAWRTQLRRPVVVSTNMSPEVMDYSALKKPTFDSSKEPYSRPLGREFTRKWAVDFTTARQLRESRTTVSQTYLPAATTPTQPVEVSSAKPTVGRAREIFKASRMMKPAEHIDRLDREYTLFDNKRSKKQKKAEQGDYAEPERDDIHERSHEVYLPRSLQDSIHRMPAEMEAVLTHSNHQKRTLKSLVSKKKRRYTSYGFDLDLTYITPNIIAMGFPAEGREATYRNQMSEVQRFLNSRHPNKYRVYNLCSERAYPPQRFAHPEAPDGSVACFPFDDHCPPTLQMLKDCCEDMKQWLSGVGDLGSPRLCAIHCKAGKGRTGTIIAAYLLLAGEFDSAEEALDYYGHCRTLNAKGVTIPSQIRYVHYFERWLKSPTYGSMPAAPITLSKIRLLGIPDFTGGGGCTPYFVIGKGYRDAQGNECEYSLRNTLAESRDEMDSVDKTEPYVDFDTGLDLIGDVFVQFLHAEKRSGAGRGSDTKMFHFYLHTAFVHSDKMVIPKAHVDKACKDKSCKNFPSGFAVELHFDIKHDSPQELAHDHSDGYTVYTAVAEQGKQQDQPLDMATGATLLARRALHAQRGEPAPSPRLTSSSDAGGGTGLFSSARDQHKAVKKMKRRPGKPIDAVRRCLEVYAQETSGGRGPLVVEAELALYIADAFGGEGAASRLRERMGQANLTGCRFGWVGRRDRLFCHEVLPIMEQVLDDKTAQLWSQTGSVDEDEVRSSLELVVGVASMFAQTASRDAEDGPRLREDGLLEYRGWEAGSAPGESDVAAAWEVLNADSMAWIGLSDALRGAVASEAVFGAGRSVGDAVRLLGQRAVAVLDEQEAAAEDS